MISTDPSAPPTRAPRIAALLILLSLGPVTLAQRDLHKRPSAEVRGPKLVWRLGASNALVAIAYLRWGRR